MDTSFTSEYVVTIFCVLNVSRNFALRDTTAYESRGQLLKIARETNLPQDWQIYPAKHNDVEVCLRKAKREHVQSELLSCQKNSSKWKVIRNCIPRKESTQAVYLRDIKVIAEEIMNSFPLWVLEQLKHLRPWPSYVISRQLLPLC